jgi:hypothetical protein
MLAPKIRPRFLPTLTHVVTPAELAGFGDSVPASEKETLGCDNEQLVQQIVESLMPLVSARITAVMQELMENHLHQLEANMQVEVESMVRHAMNGCEAAQ